MAIAATTGAYMTVRTWPQLTQAEKVEDLKRDVVRIFKVRRENQDAMVSDQQRLQLQIDELRKRLDGQEIEGRFSSSCAWCDLSRVVACFCAA